jgi:hypothetical protein
LAPRPEDLVDVPVGERDDVEVPVRTGLDVGADAELLAEPDAFALRDLPLVDVVGDAVGETRVVDVDALPVVGQLEAEQRAALEEVACRADEQVVPVLTTEGAALEEANPGRSDLELPAELGRALVRPAQHEQPRERLPRAVGDVGRQPADLLEPEVGHGERIRR